MLLQQVCMAYASYRSPAGHLQLVSTAQLHIAVKALRLSWICWTNDCCQLCLQTASCLPVWA